MGQRELHATYSSDRPMTELGSTPVALPISVMKRESRMLSCHAQNGSAFRGVPDDV